jgi:hypothetical protein
MRLLKVRRRLRPKLARANAKATARTLRLMRRLRLVHANAGAWTSAALTIISHAVVQLNPVPSIVTAFARGTLTVTRSLTLACGQAVAGMTALEVVFARVLQVLSPNRVNANAFARGTVNLRHSLSAPRANAAAHAMPLDIFQRFVQRQLLAHAFATANSAQLSKKVTTTGLFSTDFFLDPYFSVV